MEQNSWLENVVVRRCVESTRLEYAGRLAEARALCLEAWQLAGDPFEATVAAHYVARYEPDAQARLHWNRVAFAQAQLANPDAIASFLPSLHVNLGRSYREIGDVAQAEHHLRAAAELGLEPSTDASGSVAQGRSLPTAGPERQPTEAPAGPKRELLRAIDEGWTALNDALDRLTPTQWATVRDSEGWTIGDHVIHLARWERSVVHFLSGRPRHTGLGIDETLYLQGPADAINVAIHRQVSGATPSAAREEWRVVHLELLALLAVLPEADLARRYRYFLPDEPGEGDGPTAEFVIFGNTAEHYAEHRAWIQALVERGP